MSRQLPAESTSQAIGHLASQAFRASHPSSWRVTQTSDDTDVGLDFQVQVVEDSKYRYKFHLQLKGSRQQSAGKSAALSKNGTFYSVRLNTSTLNYFQDIDEPVLLAFADLAASSDPRNCPVYFEWLDSTLKKLDESISLQHQKTITVRIPTQNVLTPNLDITPYLRKWQERKHLEKGFYTAVEEASKGDPTYSAARIVERLRTSAIAVQTLEGDDEYPWLDAPSDSFAGRLQSAHLLLNAKRDKEALEVLLGLEATDTGITTHEKAEYHYLRGRSDIYAGRTSAAFQNFDAAWNLEPQRDRYHLALLEAELSEVIVEDRSALQQLLDKTEGKNTDDYHFFRSKLYALRGEAKAGMAELEHVQESDTGVARALVQFLVGNYSDCRRICGAELAKATDRRDTQKERLRTFNLRLMRARTLFFEGCPELEFGKEFPIGGLPSMVPEVLHSAWQDICVCWDLAEILNFPPETELLTDITTLVGIYTDQIDDVYDAFRNAALRRPGRATIRAGFLDIAQYREDLDSIERILQQWEPCLAKVVQQAFFDFKSGNKKDVVNLVMENLSSLVGEKPRNFMLSIGLALLAAHELVLTEAEETLREALESLPESEGLLAALTMTADVKDNSLTLTTAVGMLYDRFKSGKRSRQVCEQLLHHLNPGERAEAPRLIEVSRHLRQSSALTRIELLLVCQAHATLGEWQDLLKESRDALRRFRGDPRFTALKAWALSELGDTPRALELLEEVVQRSRSEPSVLNLYAQLAARSGLDAKAKALLEELLAKAERAGTKSRILEMLLKVEMAGDPTSQRLLDYWVRFGRHNDRTDEIEEGTFLLLFFHIGEVCRASVTDDHIREFQERLKSYGLRFPESRVLYQFTLPEGASGREILEILSRKLEVDPAMQESREKFSFQLERGCISVPFSIRRHILTGMQDLLMLFEMMVGTKKSQVQFQMTIGSRPLESSRRKRILSRTPVVDVTSILVLHRLELIHHFFRLFPSISVDRAFVDWLGWAAQSHFCSLLSEKARDLRLRLSHHVGQIYLLPLGMTGSDAATEIRAMETARQIIGSRDLVFYCDDLFTRQLVCGDDDERFGLTTPEVIELFRIEGLLDDSEASEKLGVLCTWNVRAVSYRFLDALRSIAASIKPDEPIQSMESTIRRHDIFMGYLDVLWASSELSELLGRLAPFIGGMLAETFGQVTIKVDTNFISAVWLDWLRRSSFSSRSGQAAGLNLAALSFAWVAAATAQRSNYEEAAARRLWVVYQRVIETLFGDSMDYATEEKAAALAARELAKSDVEERGRICEFVLSGLVDDSRQHEAFNEAYMRARVELTQLEGQGHYGRSGRRR